jgi:hypothetical protein
VATNSSADYRARATQARRIAEKMHNHQARIDLIGMADALDAEADQLDGGCEPNTMLPPMNGI